jgi:hypothetical protein
MCDPHRAHPCELSLPPVSIQRAVNILMLSLQAETGTAPAFSRFPARESW